MSIIRGLGFFLFFKSGFFGKKFGNVLKKDGLRRVCKKKVLTESERIGTISDIIHQG